MQIIHGTTEFELPHKSAIAIGKFDGIHLGHRKLIDNILEQKNNGCLAVVFTFDPSPAVFFSGKEAKELMTAHEKRAAFERMGIDVLIEFPLNEETAATQPERFVTEYLIKKLKASVIVAGTDISFGDKGTGNAELLCEMAPDGGYLAQIIDKVTVCSAPGMGPLHRNLAHSSAGSVYTVSPSGTSRPSYFPAIRYRKRPLETPSSMHTPNSPMLQS